jgi:hypothetical protein
MAMEWAWHIAQMRRTVDPYRMSTRKYERRSLFAAKKYRVIRTHCLLVVLARVQGRAVQQRNRLLFRWAIFYFRQEPMFSFLHIFCAWFEADSAFHEMCVGAMFLAVRMLERQGSLQPTLSAEVNIEHYLHSPIRLRDSTVAAFPFGGGR